MAGNLAPTPSFPEKGDTFYERNMATPTPGREGALLFQEGLAEHAAPEFMVGASQGYETAGRSNHNKPVYIKTAQETMRERSHPGSAAWTEAPTLLGEFTAGVSPEAEEKYIRVVRDGRHQERVVPATINGNV